MALDGIWRKSTYSQEGGECVEARVHHARVEVRDTKNRAGVLLGFDQPVWVSFLADLRDGGLRSPG